MEPLDLNAHAPYKFRGSDFYVTMESKGGDSLMVEVEDRLTADQWRATFESSYVEDLTHKTGNFKQFNVFVSMLESAVLQNSNSVCLDLLTYSDLEALRHKKNRGTEVKSSIPAPRSGSNTLLSKRYLILTYTVEFDRIHYPLPLPYVGKPDPKALQDTIRQLRTENKKLKQSGFTDYNSRDSEKLQKDYRRLLKEKEELEEEFLQFRREMKSTASGNSAKEIRTLKAVVRNMEQELMREKTEHQRAASKRGHEYRELIEEVEELRASERNLRVRVKSLTNELVMYKRGRPSTRTSSRDRLPSLDRSNQQRNNSGTRQRSFSRERSAAYARQVRERSLSHDRLYAQTRRDRSSSRDRPSSAPNRSRRSESPASLRGSFNSIPRSPSPAGGRTRRFDPTDYIKEKERKKQEAILKKKRQARSSINRSGMSQNSRPSPGSINSSRYSAYLRSRSRTSSFGSQGDLSDGGLSDGSYTGRLQNHNSNSKTKESPQGASRGKVNRSASARSKVLASTPDSEFGKQRSVINKENEGPDSPEDSELFDRSAEISEIDERLNRLQQLMKATMP
ncbi:centrosomal protein CCDC61-like isoform X2 [Littorina saxatilis]|uniref:centrosomal protein CCDC61-like isoform X2 n=1 Tax=Littorina saxatilis TaxID=31220 RepID=UPI0038B465F9